MNYRLRATNDCWVVETKHVKGEDSKNPGEVTWRDPSYLPTLEQAATSLLERMMRDESREPQPIEDLISCVRDAEVIVKEEVRRVS